MRRSVLASAFALTVSLGLPHAATAQTFFQKLFGSSDNAPHSQPASRLGAPAQAAPAPRDGITAGWHARLQRRMRDDDGRDVGGPRASAGGSDEGKGQYQTYCVRTCDGYYFPISRAVPRRSFHTDAAICKSRCGVEAQLFYGSTDSDDKAALLDLTGRSYGDLPNAFKYRKSLVSGCSCRPMPWSAAELDRHRQYALVEEQKAAGIGAVASVEPARSRFALPPPVGGPGVVVMSAGDNHEQPDGPVSDVSPLATATDDDSEPQVRPAMRRLSRRGPSVAVINAGHSHDTWSAVRREKRERRERRLDRHQHQAVYARQAQGTGLWTPGWFGASPSYAGGRR